MKNPREILIEIFMNPHSMRPHAKRMFLGIIISAIANLRTSRSSCIPERGRDYYFYRPLTTASSGLSVKINRAQIRAHTHYSAPRY